MNSDQVKNNPSFFVHESSFVDEGASIDEGTSIWHFCHVFKGARIGKNCKIGQNVVVHATAVLHDHVKVQNNVSIYDGVTLEDYVFCGPSCVFTNIINPRSEVPRNTAEHYKPTCVKRGASIGANATIVCGITIGEYAFVGAGSVVTKDVKPHELVYGSPAGHKGWMCSCGVKLPFVQDKAVCPECSSKYNIINNHVSKE